jgi:hypothetical protein
MIDLKRIRSKYMRLDNSRFQNGALEITFWMSNLLTLFVISSASGKIRLISKYLFYGTVKDNSSIS